MNVLFWFATHSSLCVSLLYVSLGVGDFTLSSVSELPDPCPLPGAVKKRRSLSDKEQKLYAPMAGVGGIVYDKVCGVVASFSFHRPILLVLLSFHAECSPW